MTTFQSRTILDQIAQLEDTDQFSADHFAEWFIDGELSDDQIASLTGEQMDAVAANIELRWGSEDAQAWDDRALRLLKI